MNFEDFKRKYGERILTLAASEIVRAGIEALWGRAENGKSIDVTLAALAAEMDAADWNVVRSIVKRCL